MQVQARSSREPRDDLNSNVDDSTGDHFRRIAPRRKALRRSRQPQQLANVSIVTLLIGPNLAEHDLNLLPPRINIPDLLGTTKLPLN